MNAQLIQLTRGPTGELADANLHWQLTPTQIVVAETAWGPFRALAGSGAEHSHWDWSLKVGLLARGGYSCVGVECDGAMQGMAFVRDVDDKARLPPDRGQPLIYIDFIEIAPWNLAAIVPDPRFRGVGQRLVWAAVRLSQDRGYACRVGLHSLPQSESYYEDVCRLTAVGQDSRYNGLMYYEFTAAGAEDYLRRLGDV